MKQSFRLLPLTALLAVVLDAADAYRIVVTNERSGDVTIFAAPSHTVVATIPVGKRPRGVRISPDGKTAYVALSGSPISGPPGATKAAAAEPGVADRAADGIGVIDLVTHRLVRVIDAGTDPEQLALSADGLRLYVANEDAASASIIEIASGRREETIPVGEEPEGVETSPDGRQVYVTCETMGDIHVIDTATRQVVGKLTLGGRPRTVAFLPGGRQALIPSEMSAQLHVVDTARQRVTRSINLPPGSLPMCVQVSADGQQAYVSTGRGGTVCVIDLAAGRTQAKIQVGTRPWGLALSPDGKLLYTANGPSNDVSVVDLVQGREVARLPAGTGPWGIAVVRD